MIDSPDATVPPAIRRYIPLLVYAAIILVILVIPLKIIGYGYLPIYDDALPDAAKAVSGKPWQDILVLKSSYTMDHHIGWHTLLRQAHLLTHWNTENLALFSVVALFVLFGLSALPWLKRPEAWLATLTLLVAAGGSPYIVRYMVGRPFMVSFFALLSLLFFWQRQRDAKPSWRSVAAIATLIGLAVLLHGIWYFWVLPVAAFFLARQYYWGIAVAIGWIVGTLVAALLTGHPITYLVEAVQLALSVMGKHAFQRTLVSELQPIGSNLFPLLALGALIVLRHFTGRTTHPLHRDPTFWLACLGWVLGFKASRFWEEWGAPALMVLATIELQALFETRFPIDSLKRLGLTCGLAITLFLAATNDSDDRWTFNLTTKYLNHDDPELAGWLPEKGGIFYDVDMFFFYQTFFRNPNAEWKYLVGFEPALMPDEDFETYKAILWSNRDPKAYIPWLKKMRPEDRIAMRSGAPPQIPNLEWKYADDIWIGRLPRSNGSPTAGARLPLQ